MPKQKKPPALPWIGSRIRELRHKKGITLQRLSRSTGIDQAYLSRIENREVPYPSVLTLSRLLAALGETWRVMDGTSAHPDDSVVLKLPMKLPKEK